MTDPAPRARLGGGAPGSWLLLAAALTAALLALLVDRQTFDTNFYSLWEATNLLAGDHPYRDFFEWGVPLQAAISAAMQWLVGYRMGGEFILVHWPFIIAGVVISFDLGYRLTRSAIATGVTALIALAVLPDTPTFHYPKLFVYPAGIWLAWRYLERPGIGSAAALGLFTAIAFLFRHDHGVYIGVAAVLACGLARWITPGRSWRRTLEDAGAYTAVATLVLLPWLFLVQMGEGLPDYVRTRAHLYDMWAGEQAYSAILSRNPLEFAKQWTAPPPRAGAIAFTWQDSVPEGERRGIEQRLRLQGRDGPDGNGRWRYQVDNVYDPALYTLRDLVNDTEGLEWGRLEALNSWLPGIEPARLWLAQITVVIPLLLLASAAFAIARDRRTGQHLSLDTGRLLLAGAVLALVDAKLFREVSYAHLVAPLTAAMGARFLVAPRPPSLLGWARLTAAGGLAVLTAITAFVCLQPQTLLGQENRERVPNIFRRMWYSPPIDVPVTRAEVDHWTEGHDAEDWAKGEVPSAWAILLRYVHDCTADGDRVLVTGDTPFQVGYFVERPIAGGHLFWHHRWRTDPEHESRLLALLERQSVPFAFSTHDPVLGDLAAYPRIRRHFAANYTVLPGSQGQLLVDSRRIPTGTFGPYGFPCFK